MTKGRIGSRRLVGFSTLVCVVAPILACDKGSIDDARVQNAREFLDYIESRSADWCVSEYIRRRVFEAREVLDSPALDQSLPYLVAARPHQGLPFAEPWDVDVISLGSAADPAEIAFVTRDGTEIARAKLNRDAAWETSWRDSLVRIDTLVLAQGAEETYGERAYREAMPDVPVVRLREDVDLRDVAVQLISNQRASNIVPLGPVCETLQDRALEVIGRLESLLEELEGAFTGVEDARNRLSDVRAQIHQTSSYERPLPVMALVFERGSTDCPALLVWLESGFLVDGCDVISPDGHEMRVPIHWPEERRKERRRDLARTAELPDIDATLWRSARVRLVSQETGLGIALPKVILRSQEAKPPDSMPASQESDQPAIEEDG